MDITSNVSTTLVLSFYTSTNKYPNKNKNNGQQFIIQLLMVGLLVFHFAFCYVFFVQIQNGSLFFLKTS